MSKLTSVLSFFLLSASLSAFAQGNGRDDHYRRPKPIPVPAAAQFDMTSVSAESYVRNYYFSLKVPSTDPRLISGVEIYQAEVDDINKAATGGYGSVGNIKIGYDRYEFTMKAAKALVDAKNAGVSEIQISTHLANALVYPQGSKDLITDFSKLEFQKNEKGEAIKYLLDNGFKFNDPKFGISGPPFQPNSPLQHEKALVIFEGNLAETPADVLKNPDLSKKWLEENLVKPDVKIHSFWFGTNNHTDAYRINRAMVTENQIAGRYFLWHFRNMITVSRLGLSASQMPVEPPLQINFAKNEFFWLAGTNGTRNLNNDTRVAILESTYDVTDESGKTIKAKKYTLVSSLGNESVDTDSWTYDRMQKALRANRNAKDKRVIDQASASNGDFSVAEGRVGLIVVRPFEGGRNVLFPVYPDVRDQEEVLVWDRLAPGQNVLRRTGNPVWNWTDHDKTELAERQEIATQITFADLTFGSENGSGNFPNNELRGWFHVRGGSPIHTMTKETILGFMSEYARYIHPALDFFLKDKLAWLVGHHRQEIPWDDVENPNKLPTYEKISAALKAGQYDDLRKMLDVIAATPTSLEEKTPPETVKSNLDRFVGACKWYGALPPEKKNARSSDTGFMARTQLIEVAEVIVGKLYPEQNFAKIDNALYGRELKEKGILSGLVDELSQRLDVKIQRPQDFDPNRNPRPNGGSSGQESRGGGGRSGPSMPGQDERHFNQLNQTRVQQCGNRLAQSRNRIITNTGKQFN